MQIIIGNLCNKASRRCRGNKQLVSRTPGYRFRLCRVALVKSAEISCSGRAFCDQTRIIIDNSFTLQMLQVPRSVEVRGTCLEYSLCWRFLGANYSEEALTDCTPFSIHVGLGLSCRSLHYVLIYVGYKAIMTERFFLL